MAIQIFILILSMAILYLGAEFALDAAEKIGLYFGLSPLVVGLILVGFGTSLPEFFVSQIACLGGEPEIAMGNIIGSNIANLFLVMGISGLLSTLSIWGEDLKRQIIIHFFLTLFLGGILYFIGVNVVTTFLLGGFFIFYLGDTFYQMKKHHREELEKRKGDSRGTFHFSLFLKLILGFTLLYLGGEYLVKSGTKIGELSGIPSYVISAIFVAFGTSFPELVTALIASFKKKNTNLIIGNIIGSNIFNIAFVMGSIGLYDISFKRSYDVEFLFLLLGSLFLLGLIFFKKNFHFKGAILFLSTYAVIVFNWLF